MGTLRNAPVLPESPELKEMCCAIETGQFFYFSFFPNVWIVELKSCCFTGCRKNDLYNKDGHMVLRHNTDAVLILVKCN